MNQQAFVLAIVLANLFASEASAQAQNAGVWRCSSDGRTVYSDTPCAAGRQVAAADTRSAEQAALARRQIEQDQRFAQRLTQERLDRERRLADQGSGLAGIRSSDRDAQALREAALAKLKARAKKKPSRRLEEASTWQTAARASR